MDYPILREAKILSTKDPEALGRIQLKVYPELSRIEDSECPWCFSNDAGVHGKDFGVPLEGQLTSCIVWNRFWSEITFLRAVISKPTDHLFDTWKSEKKSEIADYSAEPDEQHLVVKELEDGFTTYHDTKSSEHGFLHPSGTYVTIDKDGQVSVQSVKKLNFHNKANDFVITVDSESGDFSFETAGKINIVSTGEVKIESSADVSVEATGKVEIKSTGPTNLESSAATTVKASSKVTIDAPILDFTGSKSNGTVTPTGAGVLCGIPLCVASGAPQCG